MADNAKDRDRTRRLPGRTLSGGGGGGRSIRPIALAGNSTLGLTEAVSQSPAAGTSPAEGFPVEMALAESTGPWRRDRITLSLEAQVLMMEMKAAAKDLLEFAGQMYSNVVSQLKIAAGRFLILEPFGGYRLRWKN